MRGSNQQPFHELLLILLMLHLSNRQSKQSTKRCQCLALKWNENNTIEIVTEKSVFLKRIYYPEIKLQDLYIGSTLIIHHRLYTITNYANKATREYLDAHEVRFLCIIPASNMRHALSQVCSIAKKHGLSMQHCFTTSSHLKVSVLLDGADDIHEGDTVVELVGIQDQGASAFQRVILADCRGVSITPVTSKDMKDVLRGLRGLEINLACSLCLVKPHVLKAHKGGELLQAIQDAGFEIYALFSVHMTIPMAEELFDAYRGIVADYAASIDAVCAGPVLALAVTLPGCDDTAEVVERFRELTGPSNPALAKVLRPESLRARFGDNQLYNAVHCTDLCDDGEMECRYFFETIANL